MTLVVFIMDSLKWVCCSTQKLTPAFYHIHSFRPLFGLHFFFVIVVHLCFTAANFEKSVDVINIKQHHVASIIKPG